MSRKRLTRMEYLGSLPEPKTRNQERERTRLASDLRGVEERTGGDLKLTALQWEKLSQHIRPFGSSDWVNLRLRGRAALDEIV